MSKRPQAANPATGESSVLLTDPREHPDKVLVSHLTVSPGGRVAAPHFHRELTERFLVLEGRMGFLVDGAERTLGPGEGATIPPGVVHDWWQIGDEPASAVVEVDPGDRFLEMITTIFGLAQDGKVNADGLPDPLQLALVGREFKSVVTFMTPPPAVQSVVLPPLALLGRLLGKRAVYPEYLERMSASELVEPDPKALAALGPDGRLLPGVTTSGSAVA